MPTTEKNSKKRLCQQQRERGRVSTIITEQTYISTLSNSNAVAILVKTLCTSNTIFPLSLGREFQKIAYN